MPSLDEPKFGYHRSGSLELLNAANYEKCNAINDFRSRSEQRNRLVTVSIDSRAMASRSKR